VRGQRLAVRSGDPFCIRGEALVAERQPVLAVGRHDVVAADRARGEHERERHAAADLQQAAALPLRLAPQPLVRPGELLARRQVGRARAQLAERRLQLGEGQGRDVDQSRCAAGRALEHSEQVVDGLCVGALGEHTGRLQLVDERVEVDA
jgi:hypothetical protein